MRGSTSIRMRSHRAVLAALMAHRSAARAKNLARFFKTGPGEYGEGDRFIGLTVPQVRSVLARCDLDRPEMEALLASPWHEARLLAVLAMVRAYRRGTPDERRAIYRSYVSHAGRVNNWDLVDASAPGIVGAHLFARSRSPLFRLARSPLIWERRIAILATAYFVAKGESETTLRLAERLLTDPHDLIHKATGWMLREVGKRCGRDELFGFLDRYAARMPRTALRYAIEHLAPGVRRRYLSQPTAPSRIDERGGRSASSRAPIGRRFKFAGELVQIGILYSIQIPASVSRALGVRGRVPVLVSTRGRKAFLGTLVPSGGGRHRVYLNGEARGGAKKGRIEVEVRVVEERRDVAIPEDLVDALVECDARASWESLAPGKRRHIVEWIEKAASENTRAKRVTLAVQQALAKHEKDIDPNLVCISE
jgi:3-methyladenine DNA glycosylase AlkD